MIFKFILLAAVVVLAGCASVNSVSLTSIPAVRKAQVQTEQSKIIFLGFNFDNDFIDDAVTDLQRQCPNGKVTGLLTKDENINYFLYIVWKKRITATGYCVGGSQAGAGSRKSRGTASETEAHQEEDTQ